MKLSGYQVTVEFSEPLIMKNGSRGSNYENFLASVNTRSDPRAMGVSDFTRKYDGCNHDFYLVKSDEDANRLAKKVRDTGLVKDVHIDQIS